MYFYKSNEVDWHLGKKTERKFVENWVRRPMKFDTNSSFWALQSKTIPMQMKKSKSSRQKPHEQKITVDWDIGERNQGKS